MEPAERRREAAGERRHSAGEAAELERVASRLRRSFRDLHRERSREARAVRLWRRLVPLESVLIGHRLPHPSQLVLEAGWHRDNLDRFCPHCGVTRAPFECVEGGCAECRPRQAGRRRGDGPDALVRLGAYAPPLTQWVPAIKSRAWRSMGQMLGGELGAQVREALLAGQLRAPHMVVPVPSHPVRTLARGIAHTEVIAAEVARMIGCPMARALAIPLAARQARASRGARRRNSDRFRWRDPAQHWWWAPAWLPRRLGGLQLGRDEQGERKPLQGCSVLLIDDVRTTGGTLDDAARALRSAGAVWVAAGVCAVADPPRRNALRGR